VGRTFIQPMQDVREMKVKTKFNTVRGVIEGKKVVIVDDSIVRGTTSKKLVDLVREAGAREIHLRITSPMIRFPCHYGMDFPNPDELIANWCGGDVEKIRKEAGRRQPRLSFPRTLARFRPPRTGRVVLHRLLQRPYPTAVDNSAVKGEHEP